jgi:hypothetical protein
LNAGSSSVRRWARKRALPGARDASELPSRKSIRTCSTLSSSHSPSYHHFHFILTQLALQNTSSSTATEHSLLDSTPRLPLWSWSHARPLCWPCCTQQRVQVGQSTQPPLERLGMKQLGYPTSCGVACLAPGCAQ